MALFVFRGRHNIGEVAIMLHDDFSWQGQYLVKLDCHFLWQGQYLNEIWNYCRSAKCCIFLSKNVHGEREK